MSGKEYNPLEHSVVQALLKADATHRYEVSDYVEALIFSLHRELERVYWNWNQEQLDNREDWQLVACGFEYRTYFWGECDCGAESPIHAKDCAFVVGHSEWNRRRLDALSDPPENPVTETEIAEAETKGIARRDYVMANMHRFGSKLNFEREDAFRAANPRPPCTCGAEANWKERGYHLATCSPQLPNFKFGPVVINWYKHMGRGMSTNVDWDEKQWREWFDQALAAIRLYDCCMQVRHQAFRDEDAGRIPFSVDERVQCKDCKYCVAFGANALIWNREGSRDVNDAEDEES